MSEVDRKGPFSFPDFRYLWIGTALFMLVTNGQRYLFGTYVLDELGRDESWQGATVFALGLPSALLSLPAGVLADRLDRRKLLLAATIFMFVPVAVLAAILGTGGGGLVVILAGAVLVGCGQAFGQPVRSALAPALVPAESLFAAIALIAMAITVSMIAGPAIAQGGLSLGGFGFAFALSAALLAAAAMVSWLISPQPPETVSRTGKIGPQVREGFAHIRSDRRLVVLFGLLFLSSFTVNPAAMITSQAHVKDAFGRDAADAGLLFALMGVGMSISSVIVMRKGDMPNKDLLFQRALIGGSTAVIAMGFTQTYAQLGAVMFFMGLCGGFYLTMNQGLIQSLTPKPLMGRVMAVYSLVLAGLNPVGALALGFLAKATSPALTLKLAGFVMWICVMSIYLFGRHLLSDPAETVRTDERLRR